MVTFCPWMSACEMVAKSSFKNNSLMRCVVLVASATSRTSSGNVILLFIAKPACG